MLRLGGMAAAGAAGAAVVGAVNASPAAAANGDFLKLGTNGAPNTSSQPTGLYYNNGPDYQQGRFGFAVIDHSTTAGVFDEEPAVGGVANGTNFGAGVQGIGTNAASGVVGKSELGAAVYAVSSSSTAVSALGIAGVSAASTLAAGGTGVSGAAGGPGSLGVAGSTDFGFGVFGSASDPQGVGVFALKYLNGGGDALVALNTTAGRAILATDTHPTGFNVGGPGTGTGIQAALLNAANPSDAIVAATAGTGRGVNASSAKGIGLLAQANGATNVNPAVKAQSNGKGAAVLAVNTAAATLPAVQASSLSTVPAVQATGKAVPAGGAIAAAGNAGALTVQGVARFTRSGTVIISATFTSVVVNVPGGLTGTSHVLATMQTHLASGTPRILAAVPNTATGKITIYLDAPVPAQQTVTIAWFVFG